MNRNDTKQKTSATCIKARHSKRSSEFQVGNNNENDEEQFSGRMSDCSQDRSDYSSSPDQKERSLSASSRDEVSSSASLLTTSSNASDDEDRSSERSFDRRHSETSSEKLSSSASKSLNAHPNLVPLTQESTQLVEQVREKFYELIKKMAAEQIDDEYDPLDIIELAEPIVHESSGEQSRLAQRLITRYLNFDVILSRDEPLAHRDTERDIEAAVASLDELLKFRRHYALSDVRHDQFAREFYMLSGIFPFGQDKNELPVLYLRARVHRRWSTHLDEAFRRYVAWQLDELTKSNHGHTQLRRSIGANGIEKDGSFGICFDCLHVSYSCLDMDFLRFLVRVLVHYYPTYCRYALCVDLPWLFRSVWKLVRGWLPEEAQESVQLITSDQLIEYIDEDQIPNSMKLSNRKTSDKRAQNKHRLPADWHSVPSIDALASELELETSEIKKFKAHVDKVRKEYEQLGAI